MTGPLQGLIKPAGEPAENYKEEAIVGAIQQKSREIWNGGLAVVDDLHILSYDWPLPPNLSPTDENLKNFKTEKFKDLLLSLIPGITVILIHSTDAKEGFRNISDSGNTRRADLLAVTNPDLKFFLKEQVLFPLPGRNYKKEEIK